MMSAYRVGSEAWYEANPMAPSRAEAEADLAASKRQRRDEYHAPYDWRDQYTPEQLKEIEDAIPF